tara:strand:+ start:276 stop:1667 length:1392 start_codon:yes stop_codon:yes gene_type:complete
MSETSTKKINNNQLLKEENSLDWNQILKKIQLTLGSDVYDSWIKNIALKKEYNHYVVLSAPTRFVRDWIVSRYADKMVDIIKIFKKTIQRVEFTIEENKENLNKVDSIQNNNVVTSIESSVLNYNRFNPNNSFENFMVGESNELAYSAAKKVCVATSHYNPLYIYSPVGMGKTHLLNAIGLEIGQEKKVMFISAERFMYHFIRSIKSNEMVKFKDFFRRCNVFIIDDIQFIRGKEGMQEEFFHTFNALIDKGSQIVISSDRSPSSLDRVQDRIKSRLAGGLVIDIQPPDLKLRVKILKNKLEEIRKNFGEGYNLNDEILQFLGLEISSSVREMVGSLNRIIAFSKINNKPPSIHDCKKILKDFMDYNKKTINIEFIQKIVASYFNLNIDEMLSQRRSRSLARPRQIAMYLSKNLTTNSLPDIGRKFSNRDHTTVIHAVKKIGELIKNDHDIDKAITEIKKKLI